MTEALTSTERLMMSEKKDLPKWFDAARHVLTDLGVMEKDSGLYLAADGLPSSRLARAGRLAAAGRTEDELGVVHASLIAAAAAKLARAAKADAPAAAEPVDPPPPVPVDPPATEEMKPAGRPRRAADKE